MSSPLDLLGVTSLLGGEIAKGAIRYINANKWRILTSFMVIPGLYDVSAQMLRRSNSYIARILSPGEREDKRALVGLQSSNTYRYIGLNSGTTAYVRNALCEGWLNRKFIRNNAENSRLFIQGRRNTIVLKGIIQNSNPDRVIELDENFLFLASVICQLCSLAVFVYIIYLGNAAGIAITAVNLLSNAIIYTIVTTDVYKTPSSRSYHGVPAGNSLITNMTGEKLCMILGEEEHIQDFLQIEVAVDEGNHHFIEIIAPIMGITTAIATILVIPLMPTRTQLFLAIEFIIGLVSGILFSSRDGNKMLEKIADKYYLSGLNNQIAISTIQYTNRAAALAAVIIESRGRGEALETLLPKIDEYDNWTKYYQLLNEVVNTINTNDLRYLSGFTSLDNAVEAMCTKFPNSAGGLRYRGEVELNINTLGVRLIIDVIEAIVECENMQVDWRRIE